MEYIQPSGHNVATEYCGIDFVLIVHYPVTGKRKFFTEVGKAVIAFAVSADTYAAEEIGNANEANNSYDAV